MVSLNAYLIISAVLFSLGLFCVLVRRNAIAILMGIELILNATNVNVVAFSHFRGNLVDGPIFAMFVILLAATEAVVGLALILSIFSRYRTIHVDDVSELKG